jgi:hypothetical protein
MLVKLCSLTLIRANLSSYIPDLLGNQVRTAEFGSNGYNAEGGGPVLIGDSLRCNFDDRACCWANVPSPDDELEWQLATGLPDPARFQRNLASFSDVNRPRISTPGTCMLDVYLTI